MTASLYTRWCRTRSRIPDAKAYNNAINARLLKLEIGKDGDATTLTPVAEYVYQLDDWNKFAALGATDAEKPSSLRISEMTALGHEHFLVDERTDQVAKLFEISLEGATNILGAHWDDEATTPSLEQTDDLAAAGVTRSPRPSVLLPLRWRAQRPVTPERSRAHRSPPTASCS